MFNISTDFPPEIQAQLTLFGSNLKTARIRRSETQSQFAERLGISRPTLVAMEKGSPFVTMGMYAKALWLIGMSNGISELASPELDTQGKVAEREQDPDRVRNVRPRDRKQYDF